MSDFKKIDFVKRCQESKNIMEKYPDRIPIILVKDLRCDINVDRKKYLFPKDSTVSEFLSHIRKRIKLTQEKALFLFLENNTLPVLSRMMKEIYKDHKNQDGFLYMTYGTEICFG